MPEQTQALIDEARRRLDAADFESREGREVVRQVLAFVDSLGQQAPPDLAEAATTARTLLDDADQRADQRVEAGVEDHRSRLVPFMPESPLMPHPTQWLDDLGVWLGVLDELDTGAGQRLIADLRKAAEDGDSRAADRLRDMLDDQDLSDSARSRVEGSLDRIRNATLDRRHREMARPPGQAPAAGEVDDAPTDNQAAYELFVSQGMDPDVAREMAAAMPGGPDADPDPLIGVAPDHTVTDQVSQQRFARQQAAGIDGGGARQPHREPMFRESDAAMPLQWSTEQIAALQRRMVQAGLLTSEQIRYGWFDAPTRQGFTQLLGFSNQRAQGLWSTLDQLQVEFAEQRDQMRDDAMASFQPEPYLAPDPDALRQRARRNLLEIGRRHHEISEAEIQQMTSVLSGEFKRAHQMQQESARRVYGAEVATAFGDPGSPATTADLSDLEDVDPLASFDEWFQGEYGGEIETRETSAEVARRGQTFEQGLNQMRSMIRQGG